VRASGVIVSGVAVGNLRAHHARPPRVRAMRIHLLTQASVVLLVSCVASCANDPREGGGVSVSGPSAPSAMVGSQWRPVTLHDATGRASLADTRCSADIGFTHDGYALGYDTVNGIQSRYQITRSGYTARAPMIGGVGFLVHGVRQRLITAIDSMFEGAITANVNGDRLVLTSPTGTLVLHRNGVQPDFASSPRTDPHLKRGC
jgi:hypothetical protein